MGLMDNRCVIHVIHQDIHDHLRKYISSNINEVIRAVLNSLFFFFTERFCTHQKYQKHQKHQKHKKAPKAPKGKKSTKSTKSTKNISTQISK